ncbi:MAG: nucleotidyl transferase AbiEii/AbiGii toxin family protein [Pseudohongiellaceae bacterium]
MSLFDQMVNAAMRNSTGVGALQIVVEKELLHHDILREMSSAGLLSGLTFFGGTCLRMCYDSNRLSENLDFTAGKDFDYARLDGLGEILVTHLQKKYGLLVAASPPRQASDKDGGAEGNTQTWRVKLETRPERRDIGKQVINIDVCTVPSYQRRPMMLKNHYGVDMGTSGLIIQAESREEILADKLVALGLRPNRIKNRDLWDVGWLSQRGIKLPLELLPLKLGDHHCEIEAFLRLLTERMESLTAEGNTRASFVAEMRRFLPAAVINETLGQPQFWTYLSSVIAEYCRDANEYLLAQK